MDTTPNTTQRPSGFDSGLKCLTAVFIFTVIVRVGLTFANRTGSRAIVGGALVVVFFGLVALIAASCIFWSRRATSPRPARRWALVVAIVWASLQILAYLSVVLQISCITASPADIVRKTFSLSLPDKWTENTKDDMYSPDSFIFFEGPESAFFSVVIGQKSAGASVDILVNKQRDVMVKKFTDVTVSEITKWSSFDGKGFKIDGKIQGIAKSRVTMFGFEKGDNVCLVEEYATLGDYVTYSNDFQKLRQSFKLK